MTKMVAATCVNNKVTVDGIELSSGITILSQGKQSSSGFVLIDNGTLYYIASNATDLNDVIVKLNEMLTKIHDILQNIGTGMTGSTTAPPPTLGADLTTLTTKLSAFNAVKDNLK